MNRSLSLAVLLAGACSPPAPQHPSAPERRTFGSVFADLGAVPLTTASLAAAPELRDRLAAEMSAGLFQYLVQCALPEGQHVSVEYGDTTLEVDGASGYAPQWAQGPCDEACQEWVSACLLARGNGYGVHARLFFHTTGQPMGLDEENPGDFGFPVQEGAFFGNFFIDPPRMYACRGRGRDPFYDTIRVCTHPGSPCGIQSVGPCLEEDPAVPHACEELDATGSFLRCHDRLAREGGFPDEGRTYTRVVTSYLPATGFAGGLSTDACFDGSAPGDPVIPPVASAPAELGAPCITDDGCDPDLVCAVRTGPGICTRGCTDTDDPADEAAQCGDGGICEPLGDEGVICLQSCTARIAGGEGCRPGQICSGSHLFVEGAPPTGCGSFCRDDADCHGSFCNRRTGGCGVKHPDDPSLLADGEPCTDAAACKGICLPFVPGAGICASFLPYAGPDSRCLDPGVLPLFATTRLDDMGICVFKDCRGDLDCTPPLVCGAQGCTYGG